jgi:uncharacterized protein YhdP
MSVAITVCGAVCGAEGAGKPGGQLQLAGRQHSGSGTGWQAGGRCAAAVIAGDTRKTAQQPVRLDLDVGTVASGSLLLDEHGNLKTGVIASGRPQGKQPDEGLVLRLAAPKVDLPRWVDAIAGPSGLHGNAAAAGKSLQIDLPLQIDLETPQLDSWGGSLHKVTATLGNRRIRNGWSLDVRAHELSGSIDYLPEGNGLVRANLAYACSIRRKRAVRQMATPPWRTRAIGRHWIFAWATWFIRTDRSASWKCAHAAKGVTGCSTLRLVAPEGSLQGSARVRRSDSGKEVQTRYQLDSSDVGKLLARVGLQDTFRKGEGTLTGNMSWPGGLFDVSASQLSGEMTLALKNGRFAKVDPGGAPAWRVEPAVADAPGKAGFHRCIQRRLCF